jgi:chitodextrinase
LTTTTRVSDYMGRALVNPIPGTSDATDYVGRDVISGDRDYMGRALIAAPDPEPDPEPDPPPAWQAETAYEIDDEVSLTGGAVLKATETGTSGENEPTAPGVSETVVDGTVTWVQVS